MLYVRYSHISTQNWVKVTQILFLCCEYINYWKLCLKVNTLLDVRGIVLSCTKLELSSADISGHLDLFVASFCSSSPKVHAI